MTKVFLSLIYYGSYLVFPFIFLLIWQAQKRKVKSFEIYFLLILSLFFIWARFIEPNLLMVKNYNFTQDNKKTETLSDNLKIIIFSDIHIGIYNNERILERVVKKINELDADLVIIPGDFVYFPDKEKLNNYFSVLQKIKIPKIAVLGNHDYGKSREDVSKKIVVALEKSGVLMIDNKIKVLEIDNKKIEFTGLADLWVGDPNYSLMKESDNKNDDIKFKFLITHNPDSIYEFTNLTSTKKIDLMISGHTHAGQIRLPFIYKRMIPSEYKFDKGFYKINNTDLFITPGIGNVALPLRLFNLPEISVLKISF